MAGRMVTFLALATVLVLVPAANAAVVDVQAPYGAVGGVRSQAAGVLTLTVLARDEGLGLSRTAAAIDGRALDELATRGYYNERLDQLVVEVLMGLHT